MRIFSKVEKRLLILITILIALFSQPGLAGTLLVSNVLTNSVTLFDEATLLTIKEIKVGFMPHEVVVSPNGKIALVSNFGDILNVFPGNSLSVIDVANAKVIKTIQLPDKSRPHGIVFISDSQALVTAQGMQSLLEINVLTGVIEKIIPLPGAGSHMVIVDNEKLFAYVASTDSGSVCKIDLRNYSIVAERKIGKQAEGLTLTLEEDLLLVTDRSDDYIAVIRAKDLSFLKNIKTDHGPVRVTIFNNGKSAALTNTLSGNAQVIDIPSLAITNTFDTTLSASPLPVPINIHVRDDQKTAYITNSFVNNITLVDLIKGEILKTFKANLMPDGVAISSVDAINNQSTIDGAIFKADPIDINANIEDVWQITKNVEDYNRITHGAVTAHVDGPIAPGKIIKLALYKDKIIGKFIPESNETVTVVDDDRKILAWIRKIPDGNFTERYQLLEKLSANKTRSFIIVRIPGLFGEMTKITVGETINKALFELNNGIKEEAEQHRSA